MMSLKKKKIMIYQIHFHLLKNRQILNKKHYIALNSLLKAHKDQLLKLKTLQLCLHQIAIEDLQLNKIMIHKDKIDLILNLLDKMHLINNILIKILKDMKSHRNLYKIHNMDTLQMLQAYKDITKIMKSKLYLLNLNMLKKIINSFLQMIEILNKIILHIHKKFKLLRSNSKQFL